MTEVARRNDAEPPSAVGGVIIVSFLCTHEEPLVALVSIGGSGGFSIVRPVWPTPFFHHFLPLTTHRFH